MSGGPEQVTVATYDHKTAEKLVVTVSR